MTEENKSKRRGYIRSWYTNLSDDMKKGLKKNVWKKEDMQETGIIQWLKLAGVVYNGTLGTAISIDFLIFSIIFTLIQSKSTSKNRKLSKWSNMLIVKKSSK